MATEHQNNEKSFWSQRWQEGSTGWDLGGTHPGLPAAVELLLGVRSDSDDGTRSVLEAYVPGCGRAHDVAWLAQYKGGGQVPLWRKVVGVDFAPEAIKEARDLYGQVEGVSLRCEDAASVTEQDREWYHLVFDRAMLCALRPDLRPSYMASVADRLAPGGVHLVFLFDRIKPRHEGENPRTSGPPFEIDLPLYEQLACPLGFEILAQRPWLTRWPSGREMSELIVVARKKILRSIQSPFSTDSRTGP